MEPNEISQPVSIFLDWVKTLLPKDKYNIFVSLFRFPCPTVQLTGSIFTELERVFEGKNPSALFQFSDPVYKMDWDKYRKEFLKEPKVWRKKGWDLVRTAINSVLVVDLPTVQNSELPEPYFYFLGIESVIEYRMKGSSDFEYIIFKQPENRIAVFDDTTYRVYQLTAKGEIPDVALVETAHGLGYCPARFFWSTELMQSMPELKKSPVSPQLANLDWLLFFSISKRHLDLYAPYPIYSAYEADCDFANNETGDYCDGGFLRNRDQNYKVLRDGAIEPCPVCSKRRIMGVGSYVEAPMPTGKDDPDLMRNPIKITTIDRQSLDYNVAEVQRLSEEIILNVIGRGGDVQQKQSINETQVMANFESRTSVLNGLKGNLEAAQTFVDETVCRLRYGEHFIGSSISMGTEFYIHTLADLYTQYSQAKTNGSSEAELDALSSHIISTEYKDNPMLRQRMTVLKHLEPYRHYTLAELMQLQTASLLNAEALTIKINFSTFVDRFERENTNILDFGLQLDFDKKIQIINQKFKDYAKEQRNDGAPQTGESGQKERGLPSRESGEGAGGNQPEAGGKADGKT